MFYLLIVYYLATNYFWFIILLGQFARKNKIENKVENFVINDLCTYLNYPCNTLVITKNTL